jgi:hypothetical protein
MLAAKGGRQRLMAVRSMELSRRDHLDKTQFETLDVFPDRSWQWNGWPSVPLNLSVCNVTAGVSQLSQLNFWHLTNTDDKTLSACSRGLQSDQLLWLNETAWFHPDPVRIVHEKGLPGNVDVLETKLEGGYFRADFYVDKRTHLPVEIVEYQTAWWDAIHRTGEHQLLVHYRLPNYHEVDGIMVPSGIAEQDLAHRGDAEIRFRGVEKSEVHFNVSYREEAFTERALVDLGPSAWKPGAALPSVTPEATRTFAVECKEALDVSQNYLEAHGWKSFKPGPASCSTSGDGTPAAECRTFEGGKIVDAQGKAISEHHLVRVYTYNDNVLTPVFGVHTLLGFWFPRGRIWPVAELSSRPATNGCQVSLKNLYSAWTVGMLLVVPFDAGWTAWTTNRILENEYLDAIGKVAPTVSAAPKP